MQFMFESSGPVLGAVNSSIQSIASSFDGDDLVL